MLVREFQQNAVVTTFALLRAVSTRARKTGEEFLILELQDRSGTIEADRKSTRLNSSHSDRSRMPSSA